MSSNYPIDTLGKVIAPPPQIKGYTTGELRGVGNYMDVWKIKTPQGQEMVAKRFNLSELAKRRMAEQGFKLDDLVLQEAGGIAPRSFTNLASSYVVESVDGEQVIIEEAIPTFLDEYLSQSQRKKSGLSMYEARCLLEGCARGLEDLHIYYRVVHGDLKPKNIGFSCNSVKITDRNVARPVGKTVSNVGNHLFMAPESFTRKPNFASDVYSLGAVVYHSIFGRPLFADKVDVKSRDEYAKFIREQYGDSKVWDKLVEAEVKNSFKKRSKTHPNDVHSKNFEDLLVSMLSSSRRPESGSHLVYMLESMDSQIQGSQTRNSLLGKLVLGGIIVGLPLGGYLLKIVTDSHRAYTHEFKTRIVMQYDRSGIQSAARTDLEPMHEFKNWKQKFPDKKIAILAYLDPIFTYTLLQRTGDTTFTKNLEMCVHFIRPDLSAVLDKMERSSDDDISQLIERDCAKKAEASVNSQWTEAKGLFEAAEKERKLKLDMTSLSPEEKEQFLQEQRVWQWEDFSPHLRFHRAEERQKKQMEDYRRREKEKLDRMWQR